MGTTFSSVDCNCFALRGPSAEVVMEETPQEPPQCSLPQNDTNAGDRRSKMHNVRTQYTFDKEKRVPKSRKLDQDAGYREDKWMWKPFANGLPLKLRCPPCELPVARSRLELSYEKRVETVLRKFVDADVLRCILSGKEQRWSSFAEMTSVLMGPSTSLVAATSSIKGNSANVTPNISFDNLASIDEQLGGHFPLPPRYKARVMDGSCFYRSDEEFASWRLNGPHPCFITQIERVKQIPKSFEVLDQHVYGRIEAHDTLEEAVKAHRIFLVDYSELLDDLETRPGKYLTNPIAMFYRMNSGKLMPLAIQLYGKPDLKEMPINPIFTPDDGLHAWTMAKMVFNSADLHAHLAYSLVGDSVMLPAFLSTTLSRNFHISHPLHQLCRGHVHLNLFAWENMSTTLVQDGGPLEAMLALTGAGIRELICRSWRRYEFNNKSFKFQLSERLTTPGALPGFRYQSDGECMWRALEASIKEVVSALYNSPDVISDDEELIKYFHELSTTLNRVMELHPAKGVEAIVFNITNVLFTSCQYSVLTTDLYNHYACITEFPAALSRRPIIDRPRDEITEDDLVEMLPDKRSTAYQLAVAYAFNRGPPCKQQLGGCRSMLHAGSTIRDEQLANSSWTTLSDKLQSCQKQAAEANEAAVYPYTSLDPDIVGVSVGSMCCQP